MCVLADIMMEKMSLVADVAYITELTNFLTEAFTAPVTIDTTPGRS